MVRLDLKKKKKLQSALMPILLLAKAESQECYFHSSTSTANILTNWLDFLIIWALNAKNIPFFSCYQSRLSLTATTSISAVVRPFSKAVRHCLVFQMLMWQLCAIFLKRTSLLCQQPWHASHSMWPTLALNGVMLFLKLTLLGCLNSGQGNGQVIRLILQPIKNKESWQIELC